MHKGHIQTQSPKIITILEAPPALYYDIYPYNNATAILCKRRDIPFSSTLIGESHLWSKDGYHILHHHRDLLVQSCAAAILQINAHSHYGLKCPPEGPHGLWRFPHEHPGRPAPGRFWPALNPPRDSRPLTYDAPVTYRNVLMTPRGHLTRNRNIRPLMSIGNSNFYR
jgi:hypothetical protein